MPRKPYRHKQSKAKRDGCDGEFADGNLQATIEHFLNPSMPVDPLFLAGATAGFLIRLARKDIEDARVAQGAFWLAWRLWPFFQTRDPETAVQKITSLIARTSAKELERITRLNPIILRSEYDELAETIPHHHDVRNKVTLRLRRTEWLRDLGFSDEQIRRFQRAFDRHSDRERNPNLDFGGHDAPFIEGLLAERYGISRSRVHKLLAEASHEVVDFLR